MKKMNLIFILFFLFVTQKSFCFECEGYNGVQVYPIRNTICSNSAFLIDFSEKEFKIKGQLKDLEFTAISTTGKKYKLIILETNFSGSMGQFFLKPKSAIKIGDTISISLSLKNKSELEGGINKLESYIKWKKWVVKYKKDTEKPIWKQSGEEYNLFNYGTGLAVELVGFSFSDNLYSELIKVKDYEWVPYYYRIEFMNERFISSGDHTTPRLFNGICNGNFTFENNKSYSAKIRAVDASGNFSKVSKTIYFNTTIGKVKPINIDGPYTTIPDPNFEKALIENGYDSGTIDGKVPTANISNVTYLEVSNKKISDLTGIQDFVALKTLICISNDLKTLDISKNSALTTLWCFSNQLSFLDVTKNKTLEELHCYENKLTTLDVNQNIALTKLWCYSNQLTALNVSNNKFLKELVCHTNQMTALDVTKNKDLEDLHCGLNQFKVLNVSKNKALREFSCYSNQLNTLDVSENIALEKIYCQENQLTALDVSQNMALIDLNCSSNLLPILDVKKNMALITLNCQSNQLSSLDVSKNTALTWLSSCSNQLSSLNVDNNKALIELYCFENLLTNFEVSKNIDLQILKCNSNKIAALDTSKNIALKIFDCYSNQLTALDISQNYQLTEFRCDSNLLTNLNLSQNPLITQFSCSRNKLKTLYLTENSTLTNLDCSFNDLYSLIISNGNNRSITSFNALNNPNLKCIQTDGEKAPDYWKKDAIVSFKISCE